MSRMSGDMSELGEFAVRAHREIGGQCLRLAVAGFGLAGIRGIAVRGNVCEEAEGLCLVSPFIV